ncbi:MAG: YdcF family protein [Pseudomonadota bacterium]
MISVAIAAFGLWLGGFFLFMANLDREAGRAVEAADGVVALTGGGGARIVAAAELLAEGSAGRMLISGVHPDASAETLQKVSGIAPDLFDCCVDLGRAAANTEGNAAEAAQWADENAFQTLIVVTSDYHMPRSLIMLHSALPQVKIIAYPVASDAAPEEGWATHPEAWRTLATEYTKYLITLAEARFSGAA